MCFSRVYSLNAVLQSLFWFLYIIIRTQYIIRISTRWNYQCLLFLQKSSFSLFCDIQNMTKLLKSRHQEVGSLKCKNTYRYRDAGRDMEFKLSHWSSNTNCPRQAGWKHLPLYKPGNPSLVPRTYTTVKRNNYTELSPDLHMYTVTCIDS